MARYSPGHVARYHRAGYTVYSTASQRKLAGIDYVLRNLQMELDKMRMGSVQGLLEAVEFIHADTEKTPPLTPVDTGHLRSSWNTQMWRSKGRTFIKFGYGAIYALFVHEMIGPVKWSRPNSGAKWFQAAIKRNVNKILVMIQKNSKISR